MRISCSLPQTILIQISDLQGRLVKEQVAENTINPEVDMRSVREGLYLVKISDESGRVLKSAKVIKVK